VEPIDDLDGLRRPLPNALGVQPAAIAADDLDTGMRLQPLRDRGGRALGKQSNDVMTLKIADDGSEPSATSPGPVIEPNHPGGRQGGYGRAVDEAQNRPAPPRHAQRMGQSRTRAAAHRYAQVPEG
jgi:hypothetical protein